MQLLPYETTPVLPLLRCPSPLQCTPHCAKAHRILPTARMKNSASPAAPHDQVSPDSMAHFPLNSPSASQCLDICINHSVLSSHTGPVEDCDSPTAISSTTPRQHFDKGNLWCGLSVPMCSDRSSASSKVTTTTSAAALSRRRLLGQSSTSPEHQPQQRSRATHLFTHVKPASTRLFV